MKTNLGLMFCFLMLVGCQNGGGDMAFEDATGQYNLQSQSDDNGDLSEEDLERIREQERDAEILPPGEDLDPVYCPDESNMVATSRECLEHMDTVQVLMDLNDSSIIQNYHGNLKVRSGHIVALKNSSGNFTLIGIGNAVVDEIKDVKGNILVCNMTVKVIKATSNGNIKVDGGNVCMVDGHKGNLHVNNGSIGEVKNGSGNVNVDNGDIGYVSSQNGNVKVTEGSVGSTFDTRGNITVENGNIGNIDTHRGNIRVKNGEITGTVTNVIGNVKVN